MNASDAAKVLGRAAASDNRTVTEAASLAWAESLDCRIGLRDALDAVAAHYGETRDWIMPADVNHRVRTVWRERVRSDGSPPIPAGLAYEQEQAWRPIYHSQIRQGVDRAGAIAAASRALNLPDVPELDRPVLQAIASYTRRWSA